MTLGKILQERYEIDSYGTIDESGAGISRVLKTLEDGNDFLIITASRGKFSKKENAKRNSQLIKSIRDELGVKSGAYKLVGHWKECNHKLEDGQKISDCKGAIKDELEESWLIPKPKNIAPEEFLDIAKKVAKKYDQDAFVIRIDGKLTLNGKDGTVWEDLGKADKKSISTGFSRIIDVQGYSELKKQRNKGRNINIIFEDIALVVPKDNNNSKRLFASANILY